MKYDFLVDTYETERVKVVSVWSEFRDEDLAVRPCAEDPRGRSVCEQMVHQCVSENLWFVNMLGIDVSAPPLPAIMAQPRIPGGLCKIMRQQFIVIQVWTRYSKAKRAAAQRPHFRAPAAKP